MKASGAAFRAYALAVVLTCAALALTRVTWPFFAPTPFAPVFAAAASATHWGSPGAGLLSIGLATVGALLTFPTSGPSPWLPHTTIAFIVVALIGTRLIAGRNRATAALRASEAQLRATLEHLRESEETVRKAQRMEAVGQLAAGVAHNFNNLLTITMGCTDVLRDDHGDEPLRQTAIAQIREATERGAALARQMLAFGRKHHPRLVRISLAGALDGMRDMLIRVIREDITLTIASGTRPAAVMIDPHDLEQVILNLVINARDALPQGGAIRVSSSVETLAAGDRRLDGALPPGEYVCLSVQDNGTGMSPDVQSHLFEPFFTTKEVGAGTGLGLAFVHGVARHGGGLVTVDTAPGKGTTVSVYLPPAPAASVPATVHTPATSAPPLSATTILLVEDEDAVREITARMLTRAGCRVLRAATPAEARELFERHAAEITLVVTDVVMPQMPGTALADLLRAARPELRVLFVSGYSDALPMGAEPSGSVAFLAKPFSSASLLAAIAALMAPQAAVPGGPVNITRA
jgi:signal transduction histidine kinase/ActR/RegA family two-component response regulator